MISHGPPAVLLVGDTTMLIREAESNKRTNGPKNTFSFLMAKTKTGGWRRNKIAEACRQEMGVGQKNRAPVAGVPCL
jgi:hypothetical protein